MIYHIPGVSSPQDIARFRGHLEQAEWMDGRATTGAQDAQVKNSQQVNTRNTLYVALQDGVLNVVSQHALFFAAALPHTPPTPLFNRYQNNKAYGFHVDSAVRSHPQNDWVHTDLSATLFLSDPENYDGGGLVVNDAFEQHRVKLPAGDLVLYPSDSLHCVTPVAHGVRVASFMWIQSMVRDNKKCTMLFELDDNIQSLKSHCGESEEILSLLNLHHNLLREWSKI